MIFENFPKSMYTYFLNNVNSSSLTMLALFRSDIFLTYSLNPKGILNLYTLLFNHAIVSETLALDASEFFSRFFSSALIHLRDKIHPHQQEYFKLVSSL